MTTEVENIILNKEYFELTAEELESVGELVQNAEEYDEMKWFLASTNQALVSDKIEATPKLKEKVMAHLHQDEPQRRFWLNGIAVFLWPTEKEVYRRPAFQMSLAALLLIGFLMVYNQNIEPGNNVAINDPIEIEDAEDAGSEAESFEVEDETTFQPRTTEESNEQVLDGLTKPNGGGDLGGGEGITRSPMDDRLVLDDAVAPTEESTVTDMDGYYRYDTESAEMKEDADKSISNANNNERPTTVLLSEISSNDDNRNEDMEYEKEEKLKNEGKKLDQNRSGTKDRKALNKKSKMSTADDFDALVEEDSNNNSGSDPGNSGKTEINVDEEPANSGIYNTVTIDGGFGNTVTNDIIPFQQSVKQTPELKKLFTSFK